MLYKSHSPHTQGVHDEEDEGAKANLGAVHKEEDEGVEANWGEYLDIAEVEGQNGEVVVVDDTKVRGEDDD